jgi:hypothetical protein
MEKLIKDVDQRVKKNHFKAVFVKYGTVEALDKYDLRPEDIEGFQWSSCDWPNIACPGGYCAPSCVRKDGNSMNSNANTNRNTNTNSNTNANSNRAGNS